MDNIDIDDLRIVFTKHVGPTYRHSNDLLLVVFLKKKKVIYYIYGRNKEINNDILTVTVL